MIKWFFKKLCATIGAFALLAILNSLGISGFSPGVNIINASLIVLMGVPGIISVAGLNILL